MGSKARQNDIQCLHFVRSTVLFNTAGIATGVIVGHLPLGAIISGIDVSIDVAQNAGTTNTISVGTITEPGGVLSAALSAVTNLVNAAAAGTLAYTKNTPATPNQNACATSDCAVVVSLAQTGTAATAGQATVIVTYVPNT